MTDEAKKTEDEDFGLPAVFIAGEGITGIIPPCKSPWVILCNPEGSGRRLLSQFGDEIMPGEWMAYPFAQIVWMESVLEVPAP